MRKIGMSGQVERFLRTLPPEPRHRVRLAISRLARDDTGTKALKDELAGYRRIAVGKYRVIYLPYADGVECVYAGPRKTIYKDFG
ncbi:MAG: hypothetical protein LBM92_06335 [Opitutaceae bacterium]|jgi:mRNA interferase RelE/StbE|nr:hypothetical protein [Opitutaceae bacterium]